jgi:hypothetical protein
MENGLCMESFSVTLPTQLFLAAINKTLTLTEFISRREPQNTLWLPSRWIRCLGFRAVELTTQCSNRPSRFLTATLH